MVDKKELEQMERISREAAPAALADLLDVKIIGETPAQQPLPLPGGRNPGADHLPQRGKNLARKAKISLFISEK